jgi:hypothetical protein
MLALGQEPGTHLHHPTRPGSSLVLADTARVVTRHRPLDFSGQDSTQQRPAQRAECSPAAAKHPERWPRGAGKLTRGELRSGDRGVGDRNLSTYRVPSAGQ